MKYIIILLLITVQLAAKTSSGQSATPSKPDTITWDVAEKSTVEELFKLPPTYKVVSFSTVVSEGGYVYIDPNPDKITKTRWDEFKRMAHGKPLRVMFDEIDMLRDGKHMHLLPRPIVFR